jgi:Flp pilus assembly pilin Flp
MELLKKFWNEEEGQDLIEYALLLGFITLAVVGALTAIRGNLDTLWGNAQNAINQAAS